MTIHVSIRPADQAELFEAPILPGLDSAPDIVGTDEEQALIAAIDASGLTPFRFQHWTGKRLTRSFGWSYDFETKRFAPTDPIPEWLEPSRYCAARFAGLAPDELVQALVIRYDPGTGIGWHKDRPVFDHVVGISLGAPFSSADGHDVRVGHSVARTSRNLPPAR